MPPTALGPEQTGFQKQSTGSLAMDEIQQQIEFLTAGLLQLKQLPSGLVIEHAQQLLLFKRVDRFFRLSEQSLHARRGAIDTGHVPALLTQTANAVHELVNARVAAGVAPAGSDALFTTCPVLFVVLGRCRQLDFSQLSSEDQAFHQRVAGKTIGSMQSCAGNLPDGIKPRQ